MTPQATSALHAAKHRNQWGCYATWRYLVAKGINFGLYVRARQLLVIKKGEMK